MHNRYKSYVNAISEHHSGLGYVRPDRAGAKTEECCPYVRRLRASFAAIASLERSGYFQTAQSSRPDRVLCFKFLGSARLR